MVLDPLDLAAELRRFAKAEDVMSWMMVNPLWLNNPPLGRLRTNWWTFWPAWQSTFLSPLMTYRELQWTYSNPDPQGLVQIHRSDFSRWTMFFIANHHESKDGQAACPSDGLTEAGFAYIYFMLTWDTLLRWNPGSAEELIDVARRKYQPANVVPVVI